MFKKFTLGDYFILLLIIGWVTTVTLSVISENREEKVMTQLLDTNIAQEELIYELLDTNNKQKEVINGLLEVLEKSKSEKP